MKLNFTSCSHEPCLCTGIFNCCALIFLRQVDNFAITSPSAKLADTFLDKLDKHLKQKLKRQGLLLSFNGLDIHQTKFFTKVLYETCLIKILKGHNWLIPNASYIKSPMTSDSTILKSICILTRPR